MRIAGIWVGWGLGDASLADLTVKNFKAFARRMYKSYMGDLADTNVFDQQMYDRVVMMQDKLVLGGQLKSGTFIRGVLDLETQYATTFKKRPPSKRRPVVITVEGHMSNMWIGPAAFIGAQLESEGLCWHQPIDYDRMALPFRNATGVSSCLEILNDDMIGPPEDRRPFDDEVDVYLIGFSQGSIITNQLYLNHLRSPKTPRLAARSRHLKRAIAFGDPYREKNADAGWWPDPPKPDTQGISDVRMTNTPPWWKSANRTGDLYTENPDNEAGLYRTSIYKIAAENSWSGGPAGMLQRIIDLLTPGDDIIPVFNAIVGGVMFLANMDPHGGYNLDAPTDYIRRGLRGEAQPT